MIKLVLMIKFVIFFSIMIFSFDSKSSEAQFMIMKLSLYWENIKLQTLRTIILLVNTASQCGLQYSGLQKIYDRYKDDSFVVLGVPSDDLTKNSRAKRVQVLEIR